VLFGYPVESAERSGTLAVIPESPCSRAPVGLWTGGAWPQGESCGCGVISAEDPGVAGKVGSDFAVPVGTAVRALSEIAGGLTASAAGSDGRFTAVP